MDFALTLPKRFDPMRAALGVPLAAGYKCEECLEEKPPEAFKKTTCGHMSKRCLVCELPTCVVCGEHRKPPAIRINQKEADGSYMCDGCKYPLCSHCQITTRPKKCAKYSVRSMPAWFCFKVRCRKHAGENQ